MGIIASINRFFGRVPDTVHEKTAQESGHGVRGSTEQGRRTDLDTALRRAYQMMEIDPQLRAAILDIREMQTLDPRVKKIHGRMCRSVTKGGLKLKIASTETRILQEWKKFERRLDLNRPEKLKSDCRGLVMEGNLPLQWILDERNQVAGAIRMPTETIVPLVGENGRFLDVRRAYEQRDPWHSQPLASFAMWQLTLARLEPNNWDDMGAYGRPYLDASRRPWRQLTMTEDDLVIRRRDRAPQRFSHVLEGADKTELDEYKRDTEQAKEEITTDFYQNRKGGVTALQGDANLDQIADVVHLLDTFFSGAPAPKGLFGYVGDLSRDILEDLKRDYYEELEALQEAQAWAYEGGFRLHLLLQGIDPDNHDLRVQFAERRTETGNQQADRALKYQALGASEQTVLETAGLDPSREAEQREDEAKRTDPYPDDRPDEDSPRRPRVSVTPGNERQGDSGTTISTRSGND